MLLLFIAGGVFAVVTYRQKVAALDDNLRQYEQKVADFDERVSQFEAEHTEWTKARKEDEAYKKIESAALAEYAQFYREMCDAIRLSHSEAEAENLPSDFFLSHSRGSNPRPAHYECAALPTELKWQFAPIRTKWIANVMLKAYFCKD